MIYVYTVIILLELLIIVYQITLLMVQKNQYQKFVKENNEWKARMEETYLRNIDNILQKNDDLITSINNLLKTKT